MEKAAGRAGSPFTPLTRLLNCSLLQHDRPEAGLAETGELLHLRLCPSHSHRQPETPVQKTRR